MVKYLCVCDGGNVRSAALAYVLHDHLDQEAVAVGRLRVSKKTLDTLCSWADRIVVMQPHMEESIDPRFKSKLFCFDVGPDRYGLWIHPELLEQVKAGAAWLTAKEK